MSHPFVSFLSSFVPQLQKKYYQLNKLLWILETTGSSDAADLKVELEMELRGLFQNQKAYEQLLEWKNDSFDDMLLERQLDVLIRSFKENQIPQDLAEKIARIEDEMMEDYAHFRPEIEGKQLTENEIREILTKENDPEIRKQAWGASKELGVVLAPKILKVVRLRNEAAQSLGYSNYFDMQLDLQEVDKKWLMETFDDLADRSSEAHQKVLDHVEMVQPNDFGVSKEELGPWAWSEPFGQEDPLDTHLLDSLVQDLNFIEVSKNFFLKMGFDTQEVLDKSDLYERKGKNQHAFCIDLDREGDVRTLNNIKPSIRWLETILHELGHAVYFQKLDPNLPWLIREPANNLTTEAIALICGRQAYRALFMRPLIKQESPILKDLDQSLKRRQLIFSRWVLVMTRFEMALYENPDQDLNRLWWELVEKYQKIKAPQGRENHPDWASKYHMALAPAYYFGYLLGELLASSLYEAVESEDLAHKKVGEILETRLFAPGNSYRWDVLIEKVCGKKLSADAWLSEFATE